MKSEHTGTKRRLCRSSDGAPRAVATVQSLADAAAVPAHLVRYYTRIGLLRARRNPRNGYKLYAHEHLARLRFIRQAQALGYTLAEIRQILNDADRGDLPCPRVRAILERRRAEVRYRAREVGELQRRIERALEEWKHRPDGTPDGRAVCRFVERKASD